MTQTQYKSRRPKGDFVSHADTQELRHYQSLASKFPPLRHAELLALSRTFVKGRDAGVSLDESHIVSIILDDDWSDDNILAHKEQIIKAYSDNIAWISDKPTANDIIASFVASAPDLYDAREDNLIPDIFWEDPISIDSAYPPAKTMTPEQFSLSRGQALSALRKKMTDAKPQDTPKDVIDRWKACKKELSARFLVHIKQLPHTKVSIRRAVRAEESGQQALSDIVNHNLQLAMSRVGRMMKNNKRAQNIGVADLIGAANIGLILGARQFDPERGRKFSTYAAYHIDGQLHEILSSEDGKSGIKGMSPHEQKQLGTILSIRKSFESIYDRAPTLTEIQSLSGISKTIVQKRLATPQLTTQSINAPVKQGDDESVMLSDVIASEVTVDKAMDAQNLLEMSRDLKQEIELLPAVQRRILLGKTGLSFDSHDAMPTTAKALGEELGISPSDVNARYADILESLKRKLEDRGWKTGNLPFLNDDE